MLDTTWIAQDNWIVKQIMPSSVVDLSAIGFPTFTIPGNMKEIIPPLVTEVEEEQICRMIFIYLKIIRIHLILLPDRYAIPSANSPLLSNGLVCNIKSL